MYAFGSGDTENVALANSNVKVTSLIFKVNQRIQNGEF